MLFTLYYTSDIDDTDDDNDNGDHNISNCVQTEIMYVSWFLIKLTIQLT